MKKRLYFGGTILTMEDRAPTADALLTEDGVITAVGRCEDFMEEAQGAELIDLKGSVLMPSFIDPHSHFTSYAISLLQPSVEHCETFSEIAQTIRTFIEQKKPPKGKWITVKGFDHNRLQEHAVPDRAVLDEAAPENPLLLAHQSGHTGVLNTCGLKALGIDENTPAPEGGKIEQKGGRLTGYLEENALIEAMQKIPMPTPEELEGAYLDAQNRYASYGITTMQEGMVMDVMTGMFELLCKKKLLKLDLVAYADLRSSELFLKKFASHMDRYQDHMKIGGYKVFLDGSPQARTAWMTKPYEGGEGECGYPTLTDEQLTKQIARSLKEGRQLLAHCNGDAAAQQYLDCFNRASGQLDDAPDIRPVMIHAQTLRPDQLPLMKQIGMMPSFFVAHVYHWGDVHLRNLGLERARRISCAASALKEGLKFTFHQDSPVIEPNMLETVWCAVNRITKNGVQLGKEECIDVWDALKAVTIHAAYQYFEERKKGSLAVGKLPDMIILDKDPTKVPKETIREIRVLQTIKDGETVYRLKH